MSMPYIKASNTIRSQAVTDVIESIALEECAISHILNAEGEWLQRVLTFQNLCIEDLVCMNNSVMEIIKHVTCLEAELKGKLQVFDGCLCTRYCNEELDSCAVD